ncbi:MAG TPA: DUF4136 domain-containing protein [Planctomycetota bacterium]|nr:DUF4136 domain-containing protein [Planctomycetota bacterium]
MKRILCAVLLIPLAAACAPISVSFDYDPQIDFSKYKTYAWYLPPPGTPGVDSLTQQRIRRAVDDGLQAKGFRMVEEASADFKVHAMASITERIRTQPVSMGVGYAWPHGYVGAMEGVEVTSYEEGTLIVDVIAPATKNLMWRGTAKAAVERDRTPEQREARIREAIGKILQVFPPQKK